MGGARETYLATRHGSIAISDSGTDGPALLLIHGNSACKEAFSRQFRSLKDSYRLLAFDLPGHGVSSNADPETTYNVVGYAEVAEEVLKACGVSEAFVFGWSLGGYVALEVAARGEIGILGLAIAGTSPLTVVPDDFAAGYNADSHLVLGGKQYFTSEEARAYAGSATAPKGPESAFMHRNLPRTDGRARVYMMTKLQTINWPRQMNRLWSNAFPFAIINGADDPFLNHDYIRRLSWSEGWPHRLVEIENGKHAPFFNKPEAFEAALRDIFRTAAERSPELPGAF